MARFVELHVFPDRFIRTHIVTAMNMTVGDPAGHEIHSLAGARATIEREGGQAYARGTLTRTVVGAGSWQKQQRGAIEEFVRIDGPGVFVRVPVGPHMNRPAAEFVRAFNEAAARILATAPEVPAQGGDLVGQLRQLAELRDAGAIDDQEFAAAKRRLIG